MEPFPLPIEISLHHVELAFRILLACVLGGIIGYERENANRPAGFRTHILVCVGAALVMSTGEFVHNRFGGGLDPARLGAQVVSGIGFLGAGTILRAGFNVKGLTTAASLWVVSSIGLACGIGFYFGAITATTIICATLVYFKKFEEKLWIRNSQKDILIRTKKVETVIPRVNEVFEKNGIITRDIVFLGEKGNGEVSIHFKVKMPNCLPPDLDDELRKIRHVEDAQIQ